MRNYGVSLSDEMGAELETAAKKLGMDPGRFVSEVLESELATRRLPHVRPSVFEPYDRFSEGTRSLIPCRSVECSGGKDPK